MQVALVANGMRPIADKDLPFGLKSGDVLLPSDPIKSGHAITAKV